MSADPASRFETRGVSRLEALEYLGTEQGRAHIRLVSEADPDAGPEQVVKRAVEHIMSGRTLPRLETINEALVKIVRSGSPVSPHSPYFTRAAELGGQVTRHGGAVQVLVPNRGQFSMPELVKSIDDPTHVPSLAAARSGFSGPALTRGAVAVGVVVAAVDAYSTGREVARDYRNENATAAEAKLIDFSARTGGGLAGAGTGFAVGSALGTPIVGGTIGGVVGYVGGDAIAEWRHHEAVYAQRDAVGRDSVEHC